MKIIQFYQLFEWRAGDHQTNNIYLVELML